MPKCIAIVNIWSDQNRGDAAIVVATIQALRNIYPGLKIDAHTVCFGARDLPEQYLNHFKTMLKPDIQLYPALFPSLVVRDGRVNASGRYLRFMYCTRALGILILAAIWYPLGKFLLRRNEWPAYDSLTKADLVISKGGSYLLGDNWRSVFQITMVLFPLVLASLCGRRTLLLGVSVGPVTSLFARKLMRFWFKWVNHIVLREEEAYNTCIQLGVPKDKLSILPDMAFLLPLFEDNLPCEPALLAGYPRPLVGVTVRLWNFDDIGNGRRRYEHYLEAVAYALNTFQKEVGGTIILIPQVIGPTLEGSDIEALYQLESLLSNHPIVRLPNDLSFTDLRAIYAHLDILVGTRLHSIILALGTPSVIIGYQGDKSIGTARMLGCEDTFIHINHIDGEELLKLIYRVWEHQEDIRKHFRMKKFNLRRRFDEGLRKVLCSFSQKT